MQVFGQKFTLRSEIFPHLWSVCSIVDSFVGETERNEQDEYVGNQNRSVTLDLSEAERQASEARFSDLLELVRADPTKSLSERLETSVGEVAKLLFAVFE